MATLTIQSIADTLNSNLSWNTKLSRTLISTVDGLAYTESSDSAVQSLEGILRMVRRLKLRQYQYSEIEELVPKVGEGETFIVDQCKLIGKVVAVKHIKLGDYDVDQRAFHRRLQSVAREISIMHHQPLAQHPHILKLLGYGWKLQGSSPLPYIVVEYGGGGDLRSYLQERPQSSVKSKIIHCGDVACGLMALHQCGIVHGDLKLNNVIVFESWDRPSGTIAKLCDFGHSILLAVENSSHLRYVGTTLYNAPEVAQQKLAPIEWENLHKCDIWAYGLLVWEILANGEIYFKRKWRHDPELARTAREALSGTTMGDSRSPTTGEPTEEESIQPEEEGVMGTFDSRFLRNLAIQFANKMTLPMFEKGCLRALLRLTLQEDPSARLSDLNSSPIVSVWNHSGSSSLQHKLAMHVGTSEFTFDMFQGRDIPWEHQTSMLSDFERVANLPRGSDQSTTAATFHVALCYILGFGTNTDYSKATQYLRKAEEKSHPLAQLFGSRLLTRTSNLPTSGLTDYTSIVDRGFRAKRLLSTNAKVVVSSASAKPKNQETEAPALDDDPAETYSFSNLQEYRAWLVAFIHQKSNLSRWQVTVGSGGPTMNFLECAIAMEDIQFLPQLLTAPATDWDKLGAWGETPLVQATRKGNAEMVMLLLDAFHDPCKCDESGASVYHWLFALTTGNDEAIVEEVFAALLHHRDAANGLEHASTTPHVLHPQWPLQLVGKPLAFAIVSGSLRTVKALLRIGVDPRIPVYAVGEDDIPSKWTAFHLATKYHFPQILKALVERSLDLVKSSDHPLEDLGISVRNGRDNFWKRTMRNNNFPTAILTEVLLEFPDLQLPCVLGHVTTVERYGIHGNNYRQCISDVLDILPSKSLEWRSSDGQTALMQAIDCNDYDLASILLERHPNLASVAFRDPAEKGAHTWPFHFACQIASRRDSEEATDIANRILQLHPRAILDVDSGLRTALHMSVTGSSSRVTRFLIANEAPKDAEDAEGASALHYARCLANVTVLLDSGANINYTNQNGLTAIHLAASVGADEIVHELVKRGAMLHLSNNDLGTPLHCAVMKKSRTSVCSLVQGRAPIDARDREGNTPLILAAQSGRNDIVQILLEGGADVSLYNDLRVSPLRAAILAKAAGLVEKLIKHNVEHIAKESNSQSVLHLAAEQADAAVMTILLANIPRNILSVDAVNEAQQTPLHVAAQAARADIAEALLKYGAKVNVRDSDGATPLLSACRSSKKKVIDGHGNRTEFVDLLVRSGASLLTHNDQHQNAWALARRYQDFNLMAHILERLNHMGRMDAVMSYDPPDKNLIEWAIQEEEWDFVTTCLGTAATNATLLPARLANESGRCIDRLYAYAKRRDKMMVQWVFEASKKATLTDSATHYNYRNPGRRDLFNEFHESRPPGQPDFPLDHTSPDSERPRPNKRDQSHGLSNLLHGLFVSRRSTSDHHSDGEESGPSSAGLGLSPTSTHGSI